jgi:hypothetical protein
MKFEKYIKCKLRHNIDVEIMDRVGNLDPCEISKMLKNSLNRFRALRADNAEYLDDGSGWGTTWAMGRKIVGRVNFSSDNGPLPASKWAKAALQAYVCANTVEQIHDSLPEWMAGASTQGDYVRDVVLLLHRGDVLGAVAAMIEFRTKRRAH